MAAGGNRGLHDAPLSLNDDLVLVGDSRLSRSQKAGGSRGKSL